MTDWPRTILSGVLYRAAVRTVFQDTQVQPGAGPGHPLLHHLQKFIGYGFSGRSLGAAFFASLNQGRKHSCGMLEKSWG